MAAAVRITEKEESQARYHADRAAMHKRKQEQHARAFQMEKDRQTGDAIGMYGR